MSECVWKNTDPRIDIYKSRRVLILRPGKLPTFAIVDTKHVDSIITDDDGLIEEWANFYWWTYIPEKYGSHV